MFTICAYCNADDGLDEEEREEVTRTERVCALAKRVHDALYQKAEGDMVRYRMMAGNLAHEIMELTGHVSLVFWLFKFCSAFETARRHKSGCSVLILPLLSCNYSSCLLAGTSSL